MKVHQDASPAASCDCGEGATSRRPRPSPPRTCCRDPAQLADFGRATLVAASTVEAAAMCAAPGTFEAVDFALAWTPGSTEDVEVEVRRSRTSRSSPGASSTESKKKKPGSLALLSMPRMAARFCALDFSAGPC